MDGRPALMGKGYLLARLKAQNFRERDNLFLEHGGDLRIGFKNLEMRWSSHMNHAQSFPHELLGQLIANGFQRGIGDDQIHSAAAIFHIDMQPGHHDGIGCPRDCSEPGTYIQPFKRQRNGTDGAESR